VFCKQTKRLYLRNRQKRPRELSDGKKVNKKINKNFKKIIREKEKKFKTKLIHTWCRQTPAISELGISF
jgi:hypothetical protein